MEQYRWQIIAIIAVLLAQAVVITWLFCRASPASSCEVELRQRVSEVIHLNRTAVAGALSASIAHELNQPLGAIRSYAEAAALYLKTDPPNIERVEKILASISGDNQRAADIIGHLRGLLEEGRKRMSSRNSI